MTLFGDDPSTVEKEGFTTGEIVNFRAVSFKNTDIVNIEVLYEFEPDNPSGNFRDMTLTKATKILLDANNTHFDSQSKFTIYPNPAKDKISISASTSNREFEVEIFAAKGEVMIKETFSGNVKLDVSTLRQGVYFIRISGNNQLVTQKLIIQ
jgi:hypothetical protein